MTESPFDDEAEFAYSEKDSPSAGFMSNKMYDILKFCALIAFPAFGSLYFGLASIWGLPKADEVVGTIVVVDTCLGVLLGISKKQYVNSDAAYDGDINVETTAEGGKLFSLNLNTDPEELDSKKIVKFKVNPS